MKYNKLKIRPGKVNAHLFDNVQFIYELNLAELEIVALGADYVKSPDMRVFRIDKADSGLEESLITRAAYFAHIDGKPTRYSQAVSKNRTRSVNQYLTHWIYPYKGKFHPQMIRALLNIIGMQPGETLLEPFCGSGTAALEAQLLGMNTVAIDVSPLCILQTRVKTCSFHHHDSISNLKDAMLEKVSGGLFDNNGKYGEFIEKKIARKEIAEFYLLARMLALSDESRRGRNYAASYSKSVQNMLFSVGDLAELEAELEIRFGTVDAHLGDARSTGYPDSSFDGIITSPPYSIALDYVQNDVHALTAMGYDPQVVREVYIGVRGNGRDRLQLYNEDMREVFSEMFRVLKPGKSAVIIIGNATYQSREVDSVGFTIKGMSDTGFKLQHNINKIIFGLYNVMKQENILIFEKPE